MHGANMKSVLTCLLVQESWVGYEELLFHKHTSSSGPGYLSQYSDLLRAGRSGDRILVRTRFSAPV